MKVIFKKVSPLTNKLDLFSKLDGGTEPVGVPDVCTGRGRGRLETGDPVTGPQHRGRGPALVPLTCHGLGGLTGILVIIEEF